MHHVPCAAVMCHVLPWEHRCPARSGGRFKPDVRVYAYKIVSGVHAQPYRGVGQKTDPLPANHLRPHNVKEEAAVAAVDAKAEAAAGVPRSGADAMEVEGSVHNTGQFYSKDPHLSGGLSRQLSQLSGDEGG